MQAAPSDERGDGAWSFWTSSLWLLDVVGPRARRPSSVFGAADGRPTLVARKMAEELIRLQNAADDKENSIHIAERTSYHHALLWWVDAEPLLPPSLTRPIVPRTAMIWFGSALRARFGSVASIHKALHQVAERRAHRRDQALTEAALRREAVERILAQGLPARHLP